MNSKEFKKALELLEERGMDREYIYEAKKRKLDVKVADINFVKETYNITVNDDIADAIGIGHAFVNQLNNEINWE